MRRYFLLLSTLLIAVILTSCGGQNYTEKFAFSPEKPTPGTEITVYFNAEGTALSGCNEITMVAYLFNSDLEDAIGIEMTKDGSGWKGEFTTLPSTYGAVVKFKVGDQEDSNDKKGYWIDLYNGNDIVPGLMSGKANMYARYAHLAGIDRDFLLSKSMFEEAFKKNPEIKSENLDNYLFALNRSKIENYQTLIKNELEQIEAKQNLTNDDLSLLANWLPVINENEKADKYKIELLDKDPTGKFAEENFASEINQEKDIEKRIELLNDFEVKFPNSEMIPGLYNSIVYAFSNENKLAEAKTFMSDNIDMISPYRFYQVADSASASGNKDLALEVAKMGMIRARHELDKPKSPKPKDSTMREWEDERKYYLTMNMFKYGSLLYDEDKKEEILPILDEAINLSIDYYIPQELIDLYSKVLVESGKYESALTRLGGFIEKGKSSEAVLGSLKEAYTKTKGESGFDEYIGQYEEAAEIALRAKLKKEIISAPSVPFTLTDLDGEQVSLEDYKGKIVILDFWATWCPPCKASFPGMKMAVEKYADDDEVAFLFVDTWERIPDKEKNAADFIKEHNYPFHVLMDNDYSVVGSYKIPSIPTKIIVDKEGNIRFRVAGYEGNINQLVKEIDIMIEMLR